MVLREEVRGLCSYLTLKYIILLMTTMGLLFETRSHYVASPGWLQTDNVCVSGSWALRYGCGPPCPPLHTFFIGIFWSLVEHKNSDVSQSYESLRVSGSWHMLNKQISILCEGNRMELNFWVRIVLSVEGKNPKRDGYFQLFLWLGDKGGNIHAGRVRTA